MFEDRGVLIGGLIGWNACSLLLCKGEVGETFLSSSSHLEVGEELSKSLILKATLRGGVIVGTMQAVGVACTMSLKKGARTVQ